MIYSELIQRAIHLVEEGGGRRWVRYLLLTVAVFGLAFLYNLRAYRNFNSPEAMDAAQVARNLAEGKGYTTDFIRPFSVSLVQKHNRDVLLTSELTTNVQDFARIHSPHPDLANPPVYPTILAGLMKSTTMNWKVETRKPFWTEGGRFMRYQPEFRIAIFNQVLLLAVVILTFVLARHFFDLTAAWVSVLLMLGTEPLWRFSVSGLSTMLAMAILLALAWSLMQVEELARTELPNPRRLFLMTVTTGGLLGLGMLTRYSCGWLLVPVVVFLIIFGGRQRVGLIVTVCLTFAAVVSPWIIRNLTVSGTLLGTSGYAIAEGTFAFPGTRLMQSLNPDMTSAYWLIPYERKFLENIRGILQGEVPRLGGCWVAVLFFAGLLLGLRNIAARRLRYFTMMCLGLFIVVQALGRTHLSNYSPEINTENLLVLLTPLVVVFGVGFFLTLLSQMKVPTPLVRYGVIALLSLIVWQPFIGALLPPSISPVCYPPYYPPEIQKFSGWMKEDELMMSDIPWAVAWYGNHQCTWTTANSQYDFFAFNDYIKTVQALYLTLNTLDAKLFSECLQGGVDSWGNFVLKSVSANQIPPQFPLRTAPYGLVSGLFLTDHQRWEAE